MRSPVTSETDASSIEVDSILIRLADNMDLAMTLAEVMTRMQAYASLASLSMVNREYHAILGPCLKKTQSRIVVDLSELEQLPQERYKEIEIIECHAGSQIHPEAHAMSRARGLSRKANGLSPWLLTFRGRPKKYLPDLQRECFPDIDVVRLVYNRKSVTVEEFHGCDHCPEVECDDHWLDNVMEHYCEKFFNGVSLRTAATSDYATEFRYQTSVPPPSEVVSTAEDNIIYQMDMVSVQGRSWKYRRDATHVVGMIDTLLYDQLDYEEYGSHGVRELRELR